MAKIMVIVSLVVAGFIVFYFQQDIKRGLENLETPITPAAETILIRHSFKDGIHLYAGEIALPHSCFGIAVSAERDVGDPSRVIVEIATRDGMTDDLRLCIKLPTKYPFETIAEAPEGAGLKLLVDGKELAVRLQETPWHDPRGTILNLEKI